MGLSFGAGMGIVKWGLKCFFGGGALRVRERGLGQLVRGLAAEWTPAFAGVTERVLGGARGSR